MKKLRFMYCIQGISTDPYFNLATEEYILKKFQEDCFMLWQNENSIVVGKHQNTLSEINLDYVKEKGIKVARRISGGGTVFHDLGNLNFSFIVSGEEGNLVDFRRFTKPILEVLKNLGIEAKFEGRNDLTIGGKKFSGNAEHVWKKRTLHHGTILFSSVISDLSKALKVNPLKYTDKAVKSVRSRVTNVSEHLIENLSIEAFRDKIMDHILDNYEGASRYKFTNEDIQSIEELRDNKFINWEWNFGYSPKYDFKKEIETNGGSLGIMMTVEKGIITKLKISGDFVPLKDIEELEKSFIQKKHEKDVIRVHLMEIKSELYIKNSKLEEFLLAMF